MGKRRSLNHQPIIFCGKRWILLDRMSKSVVGKLTLLIHNIYKKIFFKTFVDCTIQYSLKRDAHNIRFYFIFIPS